MSYTKQFHPHQARAGKNVSSKPSYISQKNTNMSFLRKQESTKVKGFTLVELIVVIVILAILATISFVAYGSHTSGARDSVRLSDLQSLSNSLQVRLGESGSYPLPDKPVSVLSNGTKIGYQGEVGTSVKKVLKASAEGFFDPLDKTNYTYSISKGKDRYRIGAFLEKKSNIAINYDIYLNEANAFEYDATRTFYGVGDNVPLILSSTGEVITPIQDLTASPTGIVTSSGIDVATVSNSYSGVVANSTNSGSNTLVTVSNSTSVLFTPTTYPGCDTEDIALDNGQIWAACNVGASKSYNGEALTDCGTSPTDCNSGIRNVLGNLYQWGRDKKVNGAGLVTGPLSSDNTDSFIMIPGGASDYNWISPPSNTLWGGSTSDSSTNNAQSDSTLRKGPCEIGYHVPSLKEWFQLCSYFKGSTCTSGDDIGSKAGVLLSTLKLPFAGLRSMYDGNYQLNNSFMAYWTSSPYSDGNSTNAFKMSGNAVYIDDEGRSHGFAVRCIKN